MYVQVYARIPVSVTIAYACVCMKVQADVCMQILVFDWFEAAAAVLESKMCTEIVVPDLAPSILQRSR